MAERKRETARSETDTPPAEGRGRSRRIGRGIANTLVAGLLLYLVSSGFYSVVPQVFWPERADLPESVGCHEGLIDLRSELFARAADHVQRGGQPGQRERRRWLRGWDRRHLALEPRCEGTSAEAWELLGRLRQRLEATLDRFEREEGDLTRAMDHTLASSSSAPAGSSSSSPAFGHARRAAR